jgi:hypothetical protein
MTMNMDMPGMSNMHMSHDNEAAEQPPSHHMVVFGTDAIYMSHLAMFSVPEHSYQVILEVELTGANDDPTQTFRQDWHSHPGVRFYTFEPEPFVLSDLLPTEDEPAKLTTFTGDLWRNHLEQPSTHPVKIASGVTVSVKEVIHGRRFDTAAAALPQLEYILFGRGDDTYLAHLLTRPPDFDQLIHVTVTPRIADGDLGRGDIVTIADRQNTEAQCLQSSDQAPIAGTVSVQSTSVSVQIAVGSKVYFNDDADMQA